MAKTCFWRQWQILTTNFLPKPKTNLLFGWVSFFGEIKQLSSLIIDQFARATTQSKPGPVSHSARSHPIHNQTTKLGDPGSRATSHTANPALQRAHQFAMGQLTLGQRASIQKLASQRYKLKQKIMFAYSDSSAVQTSDQQLNSQKSLASLASPGRPCTHRPSHARQ